MEQYRLTCIVVLVVFAFGSYMASTRVFPDPTPFLLGGGTGLAIGFAWHRFQRMLWKQRESAHGAYASHVAQTVSLVYLKHAPCPACGRSPGDDVPVDGFSVHSASCPILSEIIGFGSPGGA